MTDRKPHHLEFTVVDRTTGQPRVVPEGGAEELAKMWKPLTAKDLADLDAFCEATDAFRVGRSIEEVVAAHPELDRDELVTYLNCLIMSPGNE
jgi:hypothetical protein